MFRVFSVNDTFQADRALMQLKDHFIISGGFWNYFWGSVRLGSMNFLCYVFVFLGLSNFDEKLHTV